MRLRLNKKLESIFVLKELNTMIEEMINNPKYNYLLENIGSIDLVRHTIDPAQVFMDYWNEEKVQGVDDRWYGIESGIETKIEKKDEDKEIDIGEGLLIEKVTKKKSKIYDAEPISPERQQYIKNALYAVKGAPEVFNAIERCFELKIEWKYNFPIIEIFNIETIVLSNVPLFDNKIRYLLYHLLYYTQLNLYIKNLILALRGEVINNHMVMKKAFTVVDTYWREDDIF
jgi:hypothetical protein